MLSRTKIAELVVTPRTTTRLIRKLLTSRSTNLSIADEPGFDDTGNAFFRSSVSRGMFILEYGAGGSTIWASGKGAEVLSVDTDLRYVNAVNSTLSRNGLAGSEVLHAPIGLTSDWGIPVDTTPTPTNLRRWNEYLSRPWDAVARKGRWPDLVLVDGRFRVACAAESALRSLREGQPLRILFDDFADRPQYWSVLRLFEAKEFESRMVELTLKESVTLAELQLLRETFLRDCR